MDIATLLLLTSLLCLLLVLIWLYFSNPERPIPFYHRANAWSKLQDEHIGILTKSKPITKIPLQSPLKTELSYSSPMENYIKMGYGISQEQEKKQYLVPAEDMQNQLELSHADVHATPNKENSQEQVSGVEASSLRRAVSTDSLDSTTSSLMECSPDLPTVQLILTYHEPSQMFSVQVERITDVCGDYGHIWMLFFLLPHPKPLWRTEARMTPASSIEYNSIFQQCVRKADLNKIALLVQLYSSKQQTAVIMGQCRLRLKDVSISKTVGDIPVSLTLQSNKEKGSLDETPSENLGDVLFMLSFAADTLTVVISKVRGIPSQYKNVWVRLYVVQPMGKSVKKKTSERQLINGDAEISESMFFTIHRKKMMKSTIRLSVVCGEGNGSASSIGHVTIGPKTNGKELGHWTRSISSQQTNLATWHSIRPRQTQLL